ncbi:MAG TPA: carboxylesterase family protein, partial [Polyangiales bacterium]|nr:carboxylesterase family protein [Polyangiales bacterium]
KRFVMESGTCMSGLPISSVAQAQGVSAGLVNEFCSGAPDAIECLRALPASDIVNWGASAGISGAGWAPVVNPADPLLPKHPKALIAAGKYNKGQIIVGSNAREWGLFQLIGQPTMSSVAMLNATLSVQFGPVAPAVSQHYASTATDATANDVYVRLMTDVLFRCPARALARATSAQGSTVYLYHFEHGAAYHAFELPYVFGNPNPTLGAPSLAEPLRTYVQSGLTSFAKTGNPNVAGLPSWPKYATASDQHVALTNTPVVGTGLSKADCDFWDYINSLQ